MVHGISYQYNCTWFYLRKKHTCPNCSHILERRKREIIVNSESEEAKNYDFSCVDSYLHGNIKFVTFYFYCPKCEATYEIRELKKLEKMCKKQKLKNR